MPSVGVLGAISGGSKGLSKFLSEDLRFERERALETLRTDNRRETLRQDAELRNSLAVARDTANNEARVDLERLDQAGQLAVENVRRAYSTGGGGSGRSDPADVATSKWLMQNIEGLNAEDAYQMTQERQSMSPTDWRAKLVSSLMSGSMAYTAQEAGQSADEAMRIAFPDAASWPTPNPGALQMLQSDDSDSARAEFDAIYGPGAALRALNR